MNLILCGMPGVGKTTVGRKIAELSARRWYDTDDVIVERFGKISEIFACRGEAYFRKIETETTRELSAMDGLVISVGGGLVLKAENVDLLRANGKIVYLRASLSTLASRLKADGERPLLSGAEALSDKLKTMMQSRTPVYESVADFALDIDGKTPEYVAREILEKVEKIKK